MAEAMPFRFSERICWNAAPEYMQVMLSKLNISPPARAPAEPRGEDARKFIRAMNREKQVAVMLTTHDMADIEQICDRLIFLHQGEILYDGSLPAFQNAYGGHYTIALESAAPLSIRLPGLRIASQEGCKYVLESDRRDVNPEEALYHLTSQNVPIRSLQVQESSIESILIALMNKP